MRTRSKKWVTASCALFALSAGAVAVTSIPGCGCTDVGCFDLLTIELASPGGALEPGAYEVVLVVDQAPHRCAFTVTSSAIVQDDCGGRWELFSNVAAGVFSFQGAPEEAELVVRRDGAVLSSQQIEPEYESFRPNGAFCEPECDGGSVTVTLP